MPPPFNTTASDGNTDTLLEQQRRTLPELQPYTLQKQQLPRTHPPDKNKQAAVSNSNGDVAASDDTATDETWQPPPRSNHAHRCKCSGCSMSIPRLALPKDYGEATRWKTDLENSARCAAKNVEEALRCANECKLRDEKTQELASKVLADAYRLMREHEQLLCAVALNQPVDSPVGSSSPSVH